MVGHCFPERRRDRVTRVDCAAEIVAREDEDGGLAVAAMEAETEPERQWMPTPLLHSRPAAAVPLATRPLQLPEAARRVAVDRVNIAPAPRHGARHSGTSRLRGDARSGRRDEIPST